MGLFTQLKLKIDPNNNVPSSLRSNFNHLYNDFGWVGVLTGSLLAFLSIYATRIGASGSQIGLISAIPAVINLILAIPAGTWLGKMRIEKGVVLTSFVYRFFYLFFIILPFLPNKKIEIWAILLITFIYSIPNAAYAVGYNAFIGETVPVEWRAHVASIRNAYYSIFLIVTSLLCGIILEKTSFPLGYQIVFIIGVIGSILSSFQLYRVKIQRDVSSHKLLNENGHKVQKDKIIVPKISSIEKLFHIRLDIISGSYGKTIIIFFIFYLFIYLPIPLFPLFTVNVLHKSDGIISLGSALFYLAMFMCSTITVQYSIRYGNKNVTAIGSILTCLYPILLVFSSSDIVYYFTSFLGGAGWAFINVGLINYLLEKIPVDDMPAYMAWYNIVLNAGILSGSLFGPWIGSLTGIITALILFGIGRFLAGLIILRWG